jgi:hypothetical protein
MTRLIHSALLSEVGGSSLQWFEGKMDPHLKADINKMEMVQRRAARYVTNRQRNINTSSVGDMLQHLEASKIDVEMQT